MTKPIQVIKIIDDQLIVINAGSDDGITADDIFEIYEAGMEIIDPISKENLGFMDLIKAKIEIAELYPKMALCQNEEILTSSVLTPIDNFMTRKQRKSLNINPLDISGGFEDSDRIISVGDFVRKRRI